MHREKRVHFWSNVLLVVTVTLFGAALFVHGLTHDLFLEAGVLLVSLKLVVASTKLEIHTQRLERRLDTIQELLRAEAAAHHRAQEPIIGELASSTQGSVAAAPGGS